ncbi:MAG TPA: YbhB/YbcL family Raf kinase inhibitor-like protein [Candidatus Paceibacterota bacterium]|nr:YbhB/YbcL family Raf kinase inhibitor-like protein [Candidatus Paceibacterota bacterium]
METATKALVLLLAAGAIAGVLTWSAWSSREGSGIASPLQSSMDETAGFSLTSDAFPDGGMIPAAYTCDGEGASVPLAVSGIPEGTQSLALIMDDPDIPEAVKDAQGIAVYDHWVRYGITPEDGAIEAGDGGEGQNSAGTIGYAPPCPPAQYEPKEHRYVFTLYALAAPLAFEIPPTKQDLLARMDGDIIATTSLVGMYARK